MDKLTSGAASGLGAGVVIGALSYISYLANVCELCLVAIGGGLARQRMLEETAGPAWVVLGWIDHLIFSMVFGIILVYILHHSGRDYALLKGALYGAVLWLLNITFISNLAGFMPASPRAIDLIILLAYHILYGTLIAWITIRFANLEPVLCD